MTSEKHWHHQNAITSGSSQGFCNLTWSEPAVGVVFFEQYKIFAIIYLGKKLKSLELMIAWWISALPFDLIKSMWLLNNSVFWKSRQSKIKQKQFVNVWNTLLFGPKLYFKVYTSTLRVGTPDFLPRINSDWPN